MKFQREWKTIVGHLGALGLFMFGVVTLMVTMMLRNAVWLVRDRILCAALLYVAWYVMARMYREADQRREAARDIVDRCEESGALSADEADAIRQALRDGR